MENSTHNAVNAIWQTNLNTSHEKLVLYHLASKHELGEKHSPSWKSIPTFLSDFSDRWCSFDELKNATQLSEIKLSRTVEHLTKNGYIKEEEKTVHASRGKKAALSCQKVFAITEKIFSDYQ